MGCLCPPKPGIPEKINQLERLRSSVLSTIEVNKVKMETLENKIQQMDSEIKEGENDLRQNQYSYSEQEKRPKQKNCLICKKIAKEPKKVLI